MANPVPPPIIYPTANVSDLQAERIKLNNPPVAGNDGVNKEYVDETIATEIAKFGTYRYFLNSPPAGKVAESYQILAPYGQNANLTRATYRIDFPYGPGESSIVRFFLYRRSNEIPFRYYQISDNIIIDENTPWSINIDASDKLRAFTLNPETDSIALGVQSSSSPPPSGLALNVQFYTEATNVDAKHILPSSDVDVWPPEEIL